MLMMEILPYVFLAWLSLVQATRNYNIIFRGLTFDESSLLLLEDSDMQLYAYNETTSFVSGNTTLIKEIPSEAFVIVEGFQQGHDGNGFQSESSIRKQDFLCKFMETDEILMPQLLGCSNIPSQCPIPLNTYSVDSFMIGNDNLPQQRPGGKKWRFDLSLYDSNKTDATLLARASAFLDFPLRNNNN